MEKQTIIQMGDEPTVVDQVVKEISKVVEGSNVTIVHETTTYDKSQVSWTVQIVKDDIISAVRVRPATRSAGYKITHSGEGSIFEDVKAKIIGEVGSEVTISKNKINKIASESTKWDRYTIADAMTQKWKENNKDITEHPSIVYEYYIVPSIQNGIIGMSVGIVTPNNEQWESMRKAGAKNSKHCIPSGKTVMKIVANSDVDVEIEGDQKIRVHGTIEQVEQIVKKIAGNPMEWDN